jgi:hypothetical protein
MVSLMPSRLYEKDFLHNVNRFHRTMAAMQEIILIRIIVEIYSPREVIESMRGIHTVIIIYTISEYTPIIELDLFI